MGGVFLIILGMMLFRKQKQDSLKRLSCQSKAKDCAFLTEYRSQIVPVEFSLKEVEAYGSILPIEMQNIESSTIDQHVLRELLVESLKLTFIFDPLMETLHSECQYSHGHFPLKMVVRVLFRGQFYRFIDNSENQLKILINNRTTQANVKIIIAALFVTAMKKLTTDDINTALLFFSLESALYDPQQLSIPMDNQKIIKVLRKLERIIKPVEFKIWAEGIKNAKDYKGQIQAHQFLYLCSLTEKKFSNGLGSILFKPKIESLFKNLNTNLKVVQFEQREFIKQNKEERRLIRGLSFVQVRPKQMSFSKQILKEFRLRDPSKYKRPNTALLRRHVSTFLPRQSDLNKELNEENLKMSMTLKMEKADLSKYNRKGKVKMTKKNMKENSKSSFKLKLDRKVVA